MQRANAGKAVKRARNSLEPNGSNEPGLDLQLRRGGLEVAVEERPYGGVRQGLKTRCWLATLSRQAVQFLPGTLSCVAVTTAEKKASGS